MYEKQGTTEVSESYILIHRQMWVAFESAVMGL